MHIVLKSLQEVDRHDAHLRRLQRQIDAHEEQLSSAEKALKATQQSLEDLDVHVSTTRKAQHDIQRKAKRYRDRLASAQSVLQTGTGDYDAATRQVTECTRILDEFETDELVQMETLDSLSDQIAEARERENAQRDQLGQLQTDVPAQIRDLNTQVQQNRGEREAVFSTLDAEAQGRYTLLIKRKGTAVSILGSKSNACSSCQRVASAQTRSDLLRGLIVPCRGCHRWLCPQPE